MLDVAGLEKGVCFCRGFPKRFVQIPYRIGKTSSAHRKANLKCQVADDDLMKLSTPFCLKNEAALTLNRARSLGSKTKGCVLGKECGSSVHHCTVWS